MKSQKIVFAIGALLVAAAIIGGVVVGNKNKSTDLKAATSSSVRSIATGSTSGPASSTPVVVVTPSETTQQPSTSAASTKYKDGTYEVLVKYRVPEGDTNELKATFTFASDSITTSDFESISSRSRDSKRYTANFATGYEVVFEGKKIDTSFPSRISGASLTTAAYLDALDQAMNKAKI
jgi:uncharacterized protein with FMN-binding domain